MSFVSLATIIIICILLGAILINFLRFVMILILAVLSIGIVYYLFLATPQEKYKMDLYSKQISEKIYKIDSKKIDQIIKQTKTSFNEITSKLKK